MSKRIKPNDIAFMYPGFPAVVKLSAYDFHFMAALRGASSRSVRTASPTTKA
ncbi:MAG: hypothetical protein IPL91_11320 [Hyphomicrobium sp.]|nr:hypothetical protein [Hyphomicrobium sp.]